MALVFNININYYCESSFYKFRREIIECSDLYFEPVKYLFAINSGSMWSSKSIGCLFTISFTLTLSAS